MRAIILSAFNPVKPHGQLKLYSNGIERGSIQEGRGYRLGFQFNQWTINDLMEGKLTIF